jgi:hypothetical protein
MGGGLMQLVAYGAQDIYLTGNPQITFFKVVYRRHTNFAMECVEQTLNGSVGAGNSVTATVARNGDLVGRMYVTSTTSTTTDGSGIVDSAEVEIGGQKIDKQTAEWMHIWNELSTPESKAAALKTMQGCVSSGHATEVNAVGMLQVPLQFWFCRNPGLALPLIALQYHEVKVKIVLGSLLNGVASAKLWADYIYLDTDERRRFAQVSHEYLIEQVQETSASATTTQKLNFNHPVKELVWTSKSTNDYLNAKLVLNGHDRFAAQEEEYFQLRQPMDHHTAVPGQNIPQLDTPNMLGTPLPVGSSTLGVLITYGNGTTDIDAGVVTLATNSGSTPKVGDIVVISVTGVAPVVSTVNEVTSATSFEVDASVAVGANFSIHIVARAAGRCRTSKMTRKINCYSFALKPEEHQPSGTCNFSRIDNAQLTTGAALTTNDNIYAVNYNVLRVMSGMGGLAYSN